MGFIRRLDYRGSQSGSKGLFWFASTLLNNPEIFWFSPCYPVFIWTNLLFFFLRVSNQAFCYSCLSYFSSCKEAKVPLAPTQRSCHCRNEWGEREMTKTCSHVLPLALQYRRNNVLLAVSFSTAYQKLNSKRQGH